MPFDSSLFFDRDEDMISVASLMSLSRAGSFSVGGGLTINDFGGGAFSPQTPRLAVARGCLRQGLGNRLPPDSATNFHADLTELTAKLQQLERLPHEDETNEANELPTKGTAELNTANDCPGHTAFGSIGSFTGLFRGFASQLFCSSQLVIPSNN